MRKYVIGIMIGLLIAIPTTVFGEAQGMVGKVVKGTFPLIINGEMASEDVVVIEGRSYIQLRSASSMFGYDIEFVNNQVVMNRKNISNLQEIVNSANQYEFKSNALNLRSGLEKAFTIGETRYIGVSPLVAYVSYEKPYFTFKLSNEEKQIVVNDIYEQGADAFIINGRIYINPEALGLKVNIDGNTIWLE